jgi:hypothetical protein
MVQSGHARPSKPNHQYAIDNLKLSPQKPTLDGEPCYEDHPIKGKKWDNRKNPGVLLDWYDKLGRACCRLSIHVIGGLRAHVR